MVITANSPDPRYPWNLISCMGSGGLGRPSAPPPPSIDRRVTCPGAPRIIIRVSICGQLAALQFPRNSALLEASKRRGRKRRGRKRRGRKRRRRRKKRTSRRKRRRKRREKTRISKGRQEILGSARLRYRVQGGGVRGGAQGGKEGGNKGRGLW